MLADDQRCAGASEGREASAQSLLLRIADVTVEAVAGQPQLALRAAAPEERFLVSGGSSDCRLVVSVGDIPAPDPGEAVLATEPNWRMTALGDDIRLGAFRQGAADRPERLLRLDTRRGEGELRVAPTAQAGLRRDDGQIVVFPFAQPLGQLLVYWELSRAGGLGAHAAAADFGGRGCLFPGVSGRGKSTLAGLCRAAGGAILGDDRVALNRRHGRFWVFGTPWHRTLSLANPVGAELHGVFFLEQAPVNAATLLAPAAACSALLARCFPPYFSHRLMARAVDTAAELAETVPCYRLAFRPEPAAVETVLRALESGR